MKTITTTEAKAKLHALAEVERTSPSVTFSKYGRPRWLCWCRRLSVRAGSVSYRQLAVAYTIDNPLPDADIATWEGNS